MEHAGAADVLGVALRFQRAIDSDQVRQVRLVRVRHLLDAHANQEIRQPLEVLVHRYYLVADLHGFFCAALISLCSRTISAVIFLTRSGSSAAWSFASPTSSSRLYSVNFSSLPSANSFHGP